MRNCHLNVAGEVLTYRLLLVEITTGQRVTTSVAWPPFLEALHILCTEIHNIELAYEDETDESVALFWLPPAIPP